MLETLTSEIMTTLRKNMRDGWEVRSAIDLGIMAAEGKRVLIVTTSKGHSGRLSTNATVQHAKNGMMMWCLTGDYSKAIGEPVKVRVTEKTVSAKHAESMQSLPAILLEVGEFYKKKDEASSLKQFESAQDDQDAWDMSD